MLPCLNCAFQALCSNRLPNCIAANAHLANKFTLNFLPPSTGKFIPWRVLPIETRYTQYIPLYELAKAKAACIFSTHRLLTVGAAFIQFPRKSYVCHEKCINTHR